MTGPRDVRRRVAAAATGRSLPGVPRRSPGLPSPSAAPVRETPADVPRLWAEVPDPDGGTGPDGEPEQVLRVDLTWLTSSWTCIYGRGCHGIDAGAPASGCCTLGAHFTDAEDEERVAAWVARLTPAQWQRHPAGRTRAGWTATDEDGDRTTRVVDGACVLHNDPDFPGGAGCALHHQAAAEDVPHLRTKPDVCWQLPLRRSYRHVERADGTTYLEVSVGEYDRRAWGPGGADLDWYCTASPEAHVGAEPLFTAMADELRELLGEAGYDAVAEHCRALVAARGPAGGAPGRGGRALLPLAVHPATARAAGVAEAARTGAGG